MKLTINGEARDVATASDAATTMTVSTLLAALGMAELRVAVELNGAIVRRAAWDEATVTHDDVVEVVQFVGGG